MPEATVAVGDIFLSRTTSWVRLLLLLLLLLLMLLLLFLVVVVVVIVSVAVVVVVVGVAVAAAAATAAAEEVCLNKTFCLAYCSYVAFNMAPVSTTILKLIPTAPVLNMSFNLLTYRTRCVFYQRKHRYGA